jgi:LAO/AO transport system kinase
VGVGQDEVDIARAAHTVVVVSAPGLGDGVQALKSGILEIADIHAVSKADRPDAQRTVAELKDMLGYVDAAHAQHHGSLDVPLGMPQGDGTAWTVAVIATSAEAGTGIEALLDQIVAHREHLQRSEAWQARVVRMLEWRMVKVAEERIRRRFAMQRAAGSARLSRVTAQMLSRALHPAQAAAEWLEHPDTT